MTCLCLLYFNAMAVPLYKTVMITISEINIADKPWHVNPNPGVIF